MTEWLRALVPTPTWIRASLAPLLVFLAMSTDRNYLADFWHHLARGRAIVEQGSLVDNDLFTYTVPGQPFQDVNWLTQVFYFVLYERGGMDLVRLVNALTLAATLGLLVFLCWRRCGSLQVASVVSVLTFFGLWQVLTVRPQTFSFLLFVLLLTLLEMSRSRPWLLVWPPLLLALWTNLHGAFPAGLMLIGCFLTAAAWDAWREGQRVFRDRSTRTLALCLLASVLATLVNPYGWRVYEYVSTTSSAAAQRRIDEWVPPTLDLWIGKAWLVSMILLAALYLINYARSGRRPATREVCLIVCFLPLACGSARLVAWWLLLVAPLIASLAAPLLARSTHQTAERPSLTAATFFSIVLGLAILNAPGMDRYNPLPLPSRGVQRVEDDLEALHPYLLVQQRPGRIFSRFEWGEYLTWSFVPAYQVFMDGRIEIYPDRVWDEYTAVTCGADNWQAILDQYQVNYLLLDTSYHSHTGLLARVERSTMWRQLAQVGKAVLYTRGRPLPPAAPG
jgi:hypothetical protein